jgi:hypothetical protein
LPGKLLGQCRRRQQAQRQQTHRAVGEDGGRFQCRRRHVAVMAAEGNHVVQLATRYAPGQFVQRRPHRKTRPQQFDLIEQRAGQRQPRAVDLRHQRVQIRGYPFDQFGGFLARERHPWRRCASDRFQRQHDRQGEQRLRFHGRHFPTTKIIDSTIQRFGLSPRGRAG